MTRQARALLATDGFVTGWLCAVFVWAATVGVATWLLAVCAVAVVINVADLVRRVVKP
jgi:hypothetical protein